MKSVKVVSIVNENGVKITRISQLEPLVRDLEIAENIEELQVVFSEDEIVKIVNNKHLAEITKRRKH